MNTSFVSYQFVSDHETLAEIFMREQPDAEFVSLPMPTLRFGFPAFAQFAAPTVMQPGKPVHQGTPDTWWAIHAVTGRIVLYAYYQVYPFSSQALTALDLPERSISIAWYEEKLAEIQRLTDALAPVFFTGGSAQRTARSELLEAYQAVISPPLLDQYAGLALDFIRWLSAP